MTANIVDIVAIAVWLSIVAAICWITFTRHSRITDEERETIRAYSKRLRERERRDRELFVQATSSGDRYKRVPSHMPTADRPEWADQIDSIISSHSSHDYSSSSCYSSSDSSSGSSDGGGCSGGGDC